MVEHASQGDSSADSQAMVTQDKLWPKPSGDESCFVRTGHLTLVTALDWILQSSLARRCAL